MKKIIFGLILGFVLASATTSYALRIPKPAKITKIDTASLTELNDSIEQLWNLTNGRYSPDSASVASSGVGTVKMGNASNASNAGWIKFFKTDGTAIYIPYWTDDTP